MQKPREHAVSSGSSRSAFGSNPQESACWEKKADSSFQPQTAAFAQRNIFVCLLSKQPCCSLAFCAEKVEQNGRESPTCCETVGQSWRWSPEAQANPAAGAAALFEKALLVKAGWKCQRSLAAGAVTALLLFLSSMSTF